MRPNSTLSETHSESSMSSAFSDDEYDSRAAASSSSQKQFFAKLVRDTRSKVEQKTSEINATMQEKLPEWKQRGAMYSKQAKETSIEWSRRGKEAVDRWKKDYADEDGYHPAYRPPYAQNSENAVFGMPLEVAVALTRIDTDDLIPAVFRRCIEYLNHVGVHEVGIYRIPGSTITVNKLRAVFDDGSNIDFDVTRPDPHAVGTLLKMYLRELPEPIIPFELANEYTQQCMKSMGGDKKAMEETHYSPILPELLKTVRSITSRLPNSSFCLLQLLCQHLKKVADNEEENRMSISNLALIFVPTLNMGQALFHCMVEHYGDIFEQKVMPPPLPQKPRNLSMDTSTSKICHAKTMSDTMIRVASARVPPPKPSRSLLPVEPLGPPPPRVPVKLRSKSVSSPMYRAHIDGSGRVEAIGRQFETLMNSKKVTRPK